MKSTYLSKFFWGFAIIVLGVLLLFKQLGLIYLDIGALFSTYWPIIVIWIGLHGVFVRNRVNPRNGGAVLWNVFIMLIGIFFLLNNLEIEGFSYDNLYKFIVPVILILVGVSIMFKGSKPINQTIDSGMDGNNSESHQEIEQKVVQGANQSWNHSYKDNYKHIYKNNYKHNYQSNINDTQHHANFIGDIHLGMDYWELTPLEISHFIGDTIIDLTKATIPLGETRLTVSAFIGDCKIFIPHDMQVEFCVTASAFISDMKVLDRYESGFMKQMQTATSDYADAEKKLLITVSMFIGDITIMRVG